MHGSVRGSGCNSLGVKGGVKVSHRGGVKGDHRDGGERGARCGETAARPEAKSFGRVELARACVFSELLFSAFGGGWSAVLRRPLGRRV